MLLFDLALLLVLLPVCSFAPGFYFVRKFAWNPMEKFCASMGLSVILIYLLSWAWFCLGPRDSGDQLTTSLSAAISLVCCTLAILCRKQIAALFRNIRVKRAALGYAFLFGWTLILLAIIRHYSGFGWGVDWLEHFQRTLFFLHRFPASTPIVAGYQLPARPPLMNVVAGFFLAQTEDRFELFQVIFAFFNLLLFLPCCLLMPAFGLSRKPRILPLLALFAFNPVVMQGATYSWTKSLASFFVLLSLGLYLAALRKHDRLRMTAAFLAAAAGVLAHYMAGPYLLFLALHYLLFVFRKRRGKWTELGAVAGLGGLLLFTWFGWSLAVYGPDVTFKSNTSVTTAQQYKGNNLAKIGANLFDTLVPSQIRRGSLLYPTGGEPNFAGLVRDNAFAFYQVNLIFGMGLIGGPFVLWLLSRYYWRGRRSDKPVRPEWRFWRVMIPFCVLAGIAVVGERDVFGSAQLTMLPLEVLGLSLIAASFPWRGNLAVWLLIGCSIDFGLGVLLQARTEALENTPAQTVFTAAVRPWDGTWQRGSSRSSSLSVAAWENWFAKHRFALTRRMLANLKTFHPGTAQGQQDSMRVRNKLQADLAEDESMWGGWWARHNYELGFLGDASAGDSETGGIPLEILVAAAFGALMVALWREIAAKPLRQAAPARAVKSAKAPKAYRAP
jgi:hypothetical protein